MDNIHLIGVLLEKTELLLKNPTSAYLQEKVKDLIERVRVEYNIKLNKKNNNTNWDQLLLTFEKLVDAKEEKETK